MHKTQGRLAYASLALHPQQDYLAVRGQKCPRNEQFQKRITAMAATQTTRTAPLGAITTYRFVQSVSTGFASLAKWNDRRITRNALGKLSDRELDDIGLCRGDIDDVA